jgi:folate-dependent tRNA-U54 methylase TrmFO/GidA|tara:strand:+ start:581 stop:799 length:219 start_codon:yes stop_codon:yes gene_type:complete
MNSKQFSLEIEKYKKDHPGVTYMDSIINYCEERGIDTSTVGPLVNKALKEKITMECQKLNLLAKTSEGVLPL